MSFATLQIASNSAQTNETIAMNRLSSGALHQPCLDIDWNIAGFFFFSFLQMWRKNQISFQFKNVCSECFLLLLFCHDLTDTIDQILRGKKEKYFLTCGPNPLLPLSVVMTKNKFCSLSERRSLASGKIMRLSHGMMGKRLHSKSLSVLSLPFMLQKSQWLVNLKKKKKSVS